MGTFEDHAGQSTYDDMLRPSLAAHSPDSPERVDVLVVVDGRESRVYQIEFRDALPWHLKPFDPFLGEKETREVRYVQKDDTEGEPPDRKLARALESASSVVIYANGRGARAALQTLIAGLARSSSELTDRLLGSVLVDGVHVRQRQLVRDLRQFYRLQISSSPTQ